MNENNENDPPKGSEKCQGREYLGEQTFSERVSQTVSEKVY